MENIDQIKLLKILEDQEFILMDKKVKNLHFKDSLHQALLIDSPEKSKNFREIESICEYFLEKKIRRDSCLYVVGGGATSDLGGFVASIILRGINWIVVPTTLLSIVDASIGGKTAINTKYGKNLIGSFHFPKRSLYCSHFLSTLDKKEIDCGMGEVLKYLLLDPSLYSKNRDELVVNCANYKKRIIEEDPFEKGIRKILNFGHTFGHSFEKNSNLNHGRSVLLGLHLETLLFNPKENKRLHEYMKSFCQILPEIKIALPAFLETLKYDKKNIGNSISFIVGHKEKFYSIEKIEQLIVENSYAKNIFS